MGPAGLALVVVPPVDLGAAGGAQATGQSLLLATEDVDGEPAELAEVRMGGGRVVDADEHERRIQGHGGEGARGEARRLTLSRAGRHDGVTRRERAERGA